MQLSFNRMTIDQATKAKRVLISLYNLGQLPKDVLFKLFDRKLSPVLLYGDEIWASAIWVLDLEPVTQQFLETVDDFLFARINEKMY